MILRAPQRVPSHRASSANRDAANPKALPYAYICTKYRGCEVKILVLFDEATEGQEVKWRDHQYQFGMWASSNNTVWASGNGNMGVLQ